MSNRIVASGVCRLVSSCTCTKFACGCQHHTIGAGPHVATFNCKLGHNNQENGSYKTETLAEAMNRLGVEEEL